MKKLILFAVSATTLATAFAAPSQAAPPPGGPVGAKCAFNSTTDVTREAGYQIGHIRGGPLVTGESGELVCSIHVNNNSHAGSVAASESYNDTGGVVVVGDPRLLQYAATAADTISLCTEWRGASGTLYWRSGDPTEADLGGWETSPGECGEALSIEPNYPTCPLWLTVDKYANTNIAEIWQDCEPYGPII